jgi:fluoroacetyl-CoA thioesterase
VESTERIQPGLESSFERVVDERLITRHVGGKGIFATPAMIGLMEGASHKCVEELLPEGYTSVGYEVHVRHLAPAAPGTTVVVSAKLTEVKGNNTSTWRATRARCCWVRARTKGP